MINTIFMSEQFEVGKVEEVASKISLGLGDEHSNKLTRDIFERGIGLAAGLTLLSIELEEDLQSIFPEDTEN